jgi:large subunit ribosomal protein L21
MYAVFQIGGMQYRGEQGAVLEVPRRKASAGDKIDISEVLLVKDNDNIVVGTPYIEGAKIEAEVIGNVKGKKIRVYKYKRRTKYRRTQGQRSEYTRIRLNGIAMP